MGRVPVSVFVDCTCGFCIEPMLSILHDAFPEQDCPTHLLSLLRLDFLALVVCLFQPALKH